MTIHDYSVPEKVGGQDDTVGVTQTQVTEADGLLHGHVAGLTGLYVYTPGVISLQQHDTW